MIDKSVRLAAFAFALAFGLSAPSAAMAPPAQDPPAKDPPVVVLPAIKLTVVSNGKAHVYTAEVARTGGQQERGLMYRHAMARGHGMLFPMSPPRPASFWMHNTYLPLDIIFIAPDGVVTNIANGQPRSDATLDSLGPVSAVLELNAGEAKRIGLKPGDMVRYKL